MCGCSKDKIKGIETTEWGPHFWRILHFFSLKAGTSPPAVHAEELRIWTRIFHLTGKAIPCEECRKHYNEWLVAHPVIFKGMPYASVGSFVQNWWFAIHNNINVLNDKPVFDFELLQSTYSGVNVLFELATITNYINKAAAASQVKISDYKAWKSEILVLNSRYY
jgi:hypothetical protein